jgi:hypothetical protein
MCSKNWNGKLFRIHRTWTKYGSNLHWYLSGYYKSGVESKPFVRLIIVVVIKILLWLCWYWMMFWLIWTPSSTQSIVWIAIGGSINQTSCENTLMIFFLLKCYYFLSTLYLLLSWFSPTKLLKGFKNAMMWGPVHVISSSSLDESDTWIIFVYFSHSCVFFLIVFIVVVE